MPIDFPELADGDMLEPFHINIIYAELRRLRGMRGAGLVQVVGARAPHPPTIVGHAGDSGRVRIWMPTGIGAGTVGAPAVKTDAIMMIRSGDGWTTTGGTTIDKLFNCDTVGITGAKAGWAFVREDNSYELAIGDC